MEKDQTKSMLKLARYLFFLNAALWLFFGAWSFLRGIDGGNLMRWIYTSLMIANVAVMSWFGVMIASGRSWIFFLGILYMALNVVLSISDQFGWADALVLFLNLCLLGILFVTRQRIIQSARTSSENG